MSIDIYSKIENGYYEYPSKPKKPDAKCVNGHKFNSFLSNFEKIPKFCSECGIPVRDDYITKIEAWKREVSEWVKKCREIDEMFKNDLFEYLNIKDNPKRNKLFNLAWEYGHSDGLRLVVNYAEELSELLD